MSKYIELNDYMNKMGAEQQPSRLSKKTLQKTALAVVIIGFMIVVSVLLVLANNMPPIFFESILLGLAVIAMIALVMAIGTPKTKTIYTKK